MYSREFQHKFFTGLLHDCYAFQERNTDFKKVGFNKTKQVKQRVKDLAANFMTRAGFVHKGGVGELAIARLAYLVQNIDQLEQLYQLFGDDYSKQMSVELLKFRILGPRHVKLPTNNEDYWVKSSAVDRNYLAERRTIKVWSWHLNRYKLNGSRGALEFHAHPSNVLNTFLLEQYAYKKGSRFVGAGLGDVVIDGGGCWGDTAIYFADKTGEQGKVYSFEFVPENLMILRENIKLNPHIAENIEVVPNALWNETGAVIEYYGDGPSTSLKRNGGQNKPHKAGTITVDDFVRQKQLSKVDYIKLDIEGAELGALQGAKETIVAFRPKLAISLYHKDEDFIDIPLFLESLGAKYDFFLDHFTIHQEETVLFARPSSNG